MLLEHHQEEQTLLLNLTLASQALAIAEVTHARLKAAPRGTYRREDLEMPFQMMAKTMGMDGIRDLGVDPDILTQEIAMESLAELPMKVYRIVADLLRRLYDRIIAFFGLSTDRSEAVAKKTDDALEAFEERLAASERTIEQFRLVPGEKPDKEVIASIKAADAFYFKDPSGRVLNKQMIESDMTQLIPGGLRKDVATFSMLAIDGKYPELVGAIKDVAMFARSVIDLADRPAYETYRNKLLNTKNAEGLNWLLEDGLRMVRTEDLNRAEIMGFPPSKTFRTLKPLLGTRYPTLIPERAGLLQMHSMYFSTQRGRLSTDEGPVRLPRQIPRLSLAEVKEIRRAVADLDSKKGELRTATTMNQAIIKDLGRDDGATLKAASDDITKLDNGRNTADIERILPMLRNFNKHHTIAYAHLIQTHAYLDRLTMSLNAFLVMMLGINDDEPEA